MSDFWLEWGYVVPLRHGACFRSPQRMKNLGAVVVLILVLAAGGYGVTKWNSWRVKARTQRFNDQIDNLFASLQKYKEYVGSYPVGSNSEVVKALKGANPKNVIILVGRKEDVNEKGEFIDPWGTALRIYFADNTVLVRSAGPNRRFDDSTVQDADDYFRSN